MAYRVVMKDELSHGLFSFGKKKEEPKPPSVRELALQREQRIKDDRARRSQDMAVEGILKKINGLATQINALIKQYNALVNDYKSKGYENIYGPITAKLSNTSESWFTSLFHEDELEHETHSGAKAAGQLTYLLDHYPNGRRWTYKWGETVEDAKKTFVEKFLYAADPSTYSLDAKITKYAKPDSEGVVTMKVTATIGRALKKNLSTAFGLIKK